MHSTHAASPVRRFAAADVAADFAPLAAYGSFRD